MYLIDRQARNKTFYLIKKYTSYRHLNSAYELEKEFVNAFEQQLRHPSQSIQDQMKGVQEYHEKEFLYYLHVISNSEKGLDLLLETEFKKYAYDLIFEGSIYGNIFGRYGDEHGLVDDVFYQNLGLGRYYGNLDENHDHTKYVLKLLLANAMTFCVSNTLYAGEYVIPKEDRIYDKWSYESLFSKPNWPPCKQIVEPINSCPDYNENSNGQINSGEEIQISGIYEPWFEKPVYQKLTNDPEYNVYVGCPNYFLEGSEATQYKLEGTDDWYDVKWRLIWEDNRYLDGTIPEEEKRYVFDIENIGKLTTQTDTFTTEENLSVLAGKMCPKTGYWFTTAKENSRQYFKQGEVFPDFESDWGETIWYLEVTNKAGLI